MPSGPAPSVLYTLPPAGLRLELRGLQPGDVGAANVEVTRGASAYLENRDIMPCFFREDGVAARQYRAYVGCPRLCFFFLLVCFAGKIKLQALK